jgi:two-component system cell cycle response regulator DivK
LIPDSQLPEQCRFHPILRAKKPNHGNIQVNSLQNNRFELELDVHPVPLMNVKRVLVADEKATSRELIRILLEHEGCEVSEASDGWQAVAVARATLPDMVLVDLDLPQLDGYSVAREMRRDTRLKNRSIVALTENARNNDHNRLREAGFSGEIAKPVVLKALSHQLAQLRPA